MKNTIINSRINVITILSVRSTTVRTAYVRAAYVRTAYVRTAYVRTSYVRTAYVRTSFVSIVGPSDGVRRSLVVAVRGEVIAVQQGVFWGCCVLVFRSVQQRFGKGRELRLARETCNGFDAGHGWRGLRTFTDWN